MTTTEKLNKLCSESAERNGVKFARITARESLRGQAVMSLGRFSPQQPSTHPLPANPAPCEFKDTGANI